MTLEIDRQAWRGQMFTEAYADCKMKSPSGAEASVTVKAIGESLPPITRDAAFKAGGWIASSAQQRRKAILDGGVSISKIRARLGGDKPPT